MKRPQTGAEGLTSDDYLEESHTLKNPVHEIYARNRISGMSRAKAYRLAHGKVAISSGDSSNAKRMEERNSEIGFRMARLQELVAKRAVDAVAITKGYAIDTLQEVIERVMQRQDVKDPVTGLTIGYTFNPAAAIRAVDSMSNMMGWKIQPKVVEGVEGLSDEEVDRALKEYLDDQSDQLAGRSNPENEGDGSPEGEEASEAVELPPLRAAD